MENLVPQILQKVILQHFLVIFFFEGTKKNRQLTSLAEKQATSHGDEPLFQ